MPPSLKADCAVRSHTPRNRATAAGPGGRGECGEGGGAVRRGGMVSRWGVDWHGLVLGAYGEVCGVGVELW